MRRTRSLILAATVAVLAVALQLDAAAADDADAYPCAQDVAKFCSSLTGSKRLLCLQQHGSDLSADCQAYLNKREPRRRRGYNPNRAWVSACAEDVKKLCSGIASGPGVIGHCLDQHDASLSPNCKLARAARKSS